MDPPPDAGPGTHGTESFGLPPNTPDAFPFPNPFTAPPATNITPASAWSVPASEFSTVVRPNSLSVTTTTLFQFTLSEWLLKYCFSAYIAQPIAFCRFEWLPFTDP